MTHFLEPEEVDYPLTTKEGWAAFVAETVAPPVVLPPAALQRLPESERAEYDRAREDYHAQLVMVSTRRSAMSPRPAASASCSTGTSTPPAGD
ncbi:hypothetical protein [Streptomyces mirabilis]|uniref:hypothetical protein n=1 Tax=Streptomyces mirabilis TaxID=68239 RepID=UPI0031BA7232